MVGLEAEGGLFVCGKTVPPLVCVGARLPLFGPEASRRGIFPTGGRQSAGEGSRAVLYPIPDRYIRV